MKFNRTGAAALLTAAVLVLTGCGAGTKAASQYTPADDIVSYTPIDAGKRVLTVGKYVAADTSVLEKALEARFPQIDFVFTEPDAGDNDLAYMKIMADQGQLEDIQLCAHIVGVENDYLYDLAGENFTSRYNLSSLDTLNVGGKLYQIPISNTVYGIAYNKTLFAQQGWSLPSTLADFYTLCDTIRAAGIRPFAPCVKYYTVLESVAFGLSYDSVFASAENQVKYPDFCAGKISCGGLLDPAFLVMKDLYDRGYVTDDDFGASATELRQDLYAGKIAMVPTNMAIASFVESEKPASEIGFIGFPTNTPGERWMQMVPGNLLSVSARAMQDSVKKQDIRAVLEYFSTAEGQDALLQCFSGVSSLANYTQKTNALSGDVSDCLEKGRIFFADYYASNAIVPAWQKYMSGAMTLADFIAANDAAKPADLFAPLSEAPIGTAAEDFTVLETSEYITDVMREQTGADAALLLSGYFYTGNLCRIFKGDIRLPNRFVLKSVGAKNYLTTYEITGANLKALLEHPFINGAEINALYACSGLKMEYAPWAAADENVRSLTLADGSALDDGKTYTVAAWAGTIDERYIAATAAEFPDVGAKKDMMTAAIQMAGTISPPADGRIVLNWDLRAA